MPNRQQPPELAARGHRDADAVADHDREQRQQRHAADETEFLAQRGEDEIGLLFGQEVELALRALQKPLPTGRRSRSRSSAWLMFQPAPSASDAGIEEGHHAALLIIVQEMPGDGHGGDDAGSASAESTTRTVRPETAATQPSATGSSRCRDWAASAPAPPGTPIIASGTRARSGSRNILDARGRGDSAPAPAPARSSSTRTAGFAADQARSSAARRGRHARDSTATRSRSETRIERIGERHPDADIDQRHARPECTSPMTKRIICGNGPGWKLPPADGIQHRKADAGDDA